MGTYEWKDLEESEGVTEYKVEGHCKGMNERGKKGSACIFMREGMLENSLSYTNLIDWLVRYGCIIIFLIFFLSEYFSIFYKCLFYFYP